MRYRSCYAKSYQQFRILNLPGPQFKKLLVQFFLIKTTYFYPLQHTACCGVVGRAEEVCDAPQHITLYCPANAPQHIGAGCSPPPFSALLFKF